MKSCVKIKLTFFLVIFLTLINLIDSVCIDKVIIIDSSELQEKVETICRHKVIDICYDIIKTVYLSKPKLNCKSVFKYKAICDSGLKCDQSKLKAEKVCEQENELFPRLQTQEECKNVTKEYCYKIKRTVVEIVKRPIVKKVCMGEDFPILDSSSNDPVQVENGFLFQDVHLPPEELPSVSSNLQVHLFHNTLFICNYYHSHYFV